MLRAGVNALVSGKFRTPADLFCTGEELGLLRTVDQCNDLLIALRKENQCRAMLSFLEFMKKSKMEPNEATYSLIMSACVRLSDLMRAGLYFDQLRNSSGITVTAHSYRSMISACVDFKKFGRALEYINDMAEDGVVPTPTIFASLFNHLACQRTNAAEAADLCAAMLELMESSGVQPTPASRALALRVFINAERAEPLPALYQMMRDHGDQLNVNVYTDILSYCLKREAQHLDLSARIHEDMKKDGTQLTLRTYHSLLGFPSPTGADQRSLRLLDELEEVGLRPNRNTYNLAIQAYLKSFPKAERRDAWGNVQQLLDRMRAQAIAPHVATYDLLLRMCVLNEDPDRAVGYYKEMKAAGIPRDSKIFNKLIELDVRLSDDEDEAVRVADRTFILLEQSEKEGIELNCQICTAAIKSFSKEKDAEAAKLLLTRMKESGVDYDKFLLRTVFEFCILVDDDEMAESTLEEALRQNKIPATIIHTIFLSTLVQAERISSVAKLLQKMVDDAIPFDSVTRKVLEQLNQCDLSGAAREQINAILEPGS